MSTARHELDYDQTGTELVPGVEPDWPSLYRPDTARISDPAITPAAGTESISSLDTDVESDPRVAEVVQGVKSYSALAREGLERAAALNPEIDVDATHATIRHAHAGRLQKVLARMRHPHSE